VHRSLLCYYKVLRQNESATATLATVWLEQTEFCTSFAEWERITVTGPALP
jgi:hypothetical protein